MRGSPLSFFSGSFFSGRGVFSADGVEVGIGITNIPGVIIIPGEEDGDGEAEVPSVTGSFGRSADSLRSQRKGRFGASGAESARFGRESNAKNNNNKTRFEFLVVLIEVHTHLPFR